MATRRRKTPTPRKWTAQTDSTYMITARIPLDLRDAMRERVERTGETNTEFLIRAIENELKNGGRRNEV